jgi:imidazolonepropionase-like amidohydrolase
MALTLITGATVWDGISEQAVPQQVLVADGRIQRLTEAIQAPPDAQVVDLPGHTLTPGFMDCHTHVTLAPDVGPAMAACSSVAKALKSLPVLRALLMNGFTTVRDLACGDPLGAGLVAHPCPRRAALWGRGAGAFLGRSAPALPPI